MDANPIRPHAGGEVEVLLQVLASSMKYCGGSGIEVANDELGELLIGPRGFGCDIGARRGGAQALQASFRGGVQESKGDSSDCDAIGLKLGGAIGKASNKVRRIPFFEC